MPTSQAESYVKGTGEPRFLLFRIAHGSRAMVLLFALLMQIVLLPMNQQIPILSLLLQLAIIYSAIFMVADSRLHLIIGLGLGLPASSILIFTTRQEYGNLTWLAFFLILLLYLHVIRLMLVQVFSTKKVTIDTIALALCIYILLGTLWTLFYIPLAVTDGDAFIFNVVSEGVSLPDNLFYFSFVTLTTLGYGDIVPVSPMARSLTILEALAGVLFLAVLISRLVGSYNSNRRKENSNQSSSEG